MKPTPFLLVTLLFAGLAPAAQATRSQQLVSNLIDLHQTDLATAKHNARVYLELSNLVRKASVAQASQKMRDARVLGGLTELQSRSEAQFGLVVGAIVEAFDPEVSASFARARDAYTHHNQVLFETELNHADSELQSILNLKK